MSTSPFFFKAFLGTNGRPAASGWLFAYAAGSTTPKPIFSDRNNTTPLANPLRLDGNGVAPQFFTESGLYDFKVFEYNFVTPSEPGPSCFTAEDIDGETGGGGGPSYVLPIATETILGGVKPDGVTTFVDDVTGVLTAPEASYTLPIATTVTLGGVKPDGTTVQVDGVTGVLSVIPEELTPELAGYSEGGYSEFIWRNESSDIIGKSSVKNGVNLFKVSDLAAGMVLVTRWSGYVNDASTGTDLTALVPYFGGVAGPQFERAGTSTTHDINYVLTTRFFVYGKTETTANIWCQSVLEYSDNYGNTRPETINRLRYWPVDIFDQSEEVTVGMTIYNTSPNFRNGYSQFSFQAWMENAQRSSTPDPALIFQPLEDQRLSTDRSVAFADITSRAVRLDTITPDTTPVIGSMHWDDENKTAALHVANGSTVQIGQETVYFVRNNSGVTIGNGKAVYVTGSSGQKCTVALASAGDPAKNSVLAVATQEIANNSDGYVTCVGRVNDIDTSAFSDGAELWLSDSVLGGLTATMPSGGSARVHIGHVIRAHATQGSLSVAIERFPYAHELSGAGVTTRTGTSATASGTAITRYTGTGGHTEALPAATAVNGEIRKYRNSGTGPWSLVRAGSDQIDVGNPSALVTSLTLLPGQSVQIYVGAANLWEVL